MNKIKREYVISLPSNLNLEELTNQIPPNFYENGKFEVDYFKYILNLITYIPSKYKTKKIKKEHQYTPINTKLLRKAISRFHWYLDYLIEHNVLECDNSYLADKYSKGYRFTNGYYDVPFVETNITHERLLNRIFNREQLEQNLPPYLTKWFNDDLILDAEKARIFVSKMQYKYNTEYYKALLFQRVQTIINKDYYFKIDDKGYRFHSVLTNLKSELRNYLTYGGEELVSVDLSSSQPFFVTLLLNADFYNEVSNNRILRIYDLPNYEEIIQQIPFGKIKELVLSQYQQSELYVEIQQYTYWVKSNQFYQKFAESLNLIKPDEKLDDNSKKRVKEICFSVFFSDDSFNQEKIVTKISKNNKKLIDANIDKKLRKYYHLFMLNEEKKEHFKAVFPKIYEILALFKQKDYVILSLLLQRIESEIFLRRISKTFSKHFPDAPLYTIHDSIITTQNYSNNLSNIARQEIEYATGLQPSLIVENLNENNPNKHSVSNYYDENNIEFYGEEDIEEIEFDDKFENKIRVNESKFDS